MQQVLKFKIEIFDVRTRTSISVIDDTALVSSIQVRKGTTLDNTATITFHKSKTYDLLPMETILKLYNYVKIELDVTNYETGAGRIPGSKFYFSGFIQTINKASNFGTNPSATVSITVSDYANLMKTTFYTKNLTFLEILNQAVPEFRLINLSKELGDDSARLLDDFYTPTQLGFIFFVFLYFKFMYKILYEDDGSSKKTSSPDSREIFKKFKIHMPFGFEIAGSESMFSGQEQTLTIYKQLQGVALDLFKYIYPEPIFEFSTFETYDTVVLMIRLTPFMKFDRPVSPSINITTGQASSYQEKSVSPQEASFYADSYNVIERFEFGFDRIKSCREKTGKSPASLLREHLDEDKEKPKRIIQTIQNAIGYSKHLNVDDLIANNDEADEITDLFFEEIPIDTRFLESINMTRSASSVVNVIWTVPATDTAILKMSGRELIYAYLEEKLNKIGDSDKFGNYLVQQFDPGFNPNPVFLMDYRNVYKQNFVSGDMNYFGFREFEIKWNYLSVNYNATSYILANVDKDVLKKAREASKGTVVQRMIDEAMNSSNNSHKTTRTSTAKVSRNPFNLVPVPGKPGIFKAAPMKSIRQTSKTEVKPVKSQQAKLEAARKKQLFTDALARYSKEKTGLGVLDEKRIQNADTIIKLLQYAKESDDNLMGGFVSQINSVVAEAYRENEHLYDCSITKPIDLSILPGMIVKSSNESRRASAPFFKGYVTAISHTIDFNAATMKTAINISRTASDDSGVAFSPVGFD